MAASNKTRGRGSANSVDSVKAKKDLSQQGRAAEALLNNTTLTKALNDMRANARDFLEASQPEENEKRENLYRFIKTISALERQLKTYMTKGANAAKQLEEIM